MTGIDVLVATEFAAIKGMRVGLITNQTGKDRTGRGSAHILGYAPNVTLSAVFSPEHGYTGDSEDNSIGGSTLWINGRTIPLISLYRGGMAGMRPRPEHLRDLDALIFDIQDVGTRFYTYLATMAMAMEESEKAGIPFYVLDRPNPLNGMAMEGPILDDPNLGSVTPTAYFAVPIRHGVTAGEIALMHNQTVGHPKLHIIKMEGWSREIWLDQTGLPWTPPSPNISDLAAATLYPGIGCLETGNVSVGRGTPFPFRWVGAPWMDAQAVVARLRAANISGVTFEPRDYTPSKDVSLGHSFAFPPATVDALDYTPVPNIFAGSLSHGVFITITDRNRLRPTHVMTHLAVALRDLHPDRFRWARGGILSMVGSREFLRLYEAGAPAEELIHLLELGPAQFASIREPFLIY